MGDADGGVQGDDVADHIQPLGRGSTCGALPQRRTGVPAAVVETLETVGLTALAGTRAGVLLEW